MFRFLLLGCIIFEVSSISSYHYRCGNGRYIYDNWFCDGSADCPDKSDENYGCDNDACGRGKFKCTDGTCFNITIRCNTLNECSDGSDETNCGDEIDVEECQSDAKKFQCDDQFKCIDQDSTCDGYCNCLDCSDESTGCLHYDDYICSKCSDTCSITYNDTNNKLTESLSKKHKLTPCNACKYDFACEHTKCLSIEISKERCICDENYEKDGLNKYGGEICKNSVSYENVIIYSTSNAVKLFNLTTNETIIIERGVDFTALAGVHDSIYYAKSINNEGKLYKIPINSGLSELILESDSIILSIAIDWMTNNIYYTTSTSITVCSKDGRVCTKLRSCSRCRVKLSPKIGLMFWNENGTLFQSHMDGSNERNFTNDWSSYRPDVNHLQFLFAIDESTDIVYWTRNLPFIKSVRLYSEGSPKEVLMYGILGMNRNDFLELDEFDNSIYFTFENNNTIYRYDQLRLRPDPRVIDKDGFPVKNMQVYNRLLQRTKIPNPCEKSKCSLCLLKPFTSFIGLNYVCKCENANSTNGRIVCEDETREKSKSIPDATARKRDVYDVNNPPFTWGEFLWKIKVIFIIIAFVSIGVGVYYGIRKWNRLRY